MSPIHSWEAPPLPAPPPDRESVDQRIRAPLPLLLVAVGLGIAFDTLFSGQVPGVNIPLFVVIVLLAVFALGFRERILPHARNMAVIVPLLLFFAGMVGVRANGFLTFLNLTAALVLAILGAYYYRGGSMPRISLAQVIVLPMIVSTNALFRIAPLLPAAFRRMGESKPKAWIPIVRGVLLAAPVLCLFVLLLHSADAVFALVTDRVLHFLFPVDLSERVGHLVLVGIVAWVLGSGVVYTLTRGEWGEVSPADADFPLNRPLGFVEAATVLALVNALFAGFVMIQFAYLFGGASRVSTIPGLTYSEYAHQGFGELVFTAVLVLGLVLSLKLTTRRDSTRQSEIFNSLGTVLVVLTQVVLVSAFQRMRIYEAAYGATGLRIYVDVFILYLALSLGWLALTLWRMRGTFLFGLLVCVAGYIATLDLINPDAIMVRENLTRYQRTGKLDTGTLSGLSEDATPALWETYVRTTGKPHLIIGHILRDQLDGLPAHPTPGSYHLAKERARSILQTHVAELPKEGYIPGGTEP